MKDNRIALAALLLALVCGTAYHVEAQTISNVVDLQRIGNDPAYPLNGNYWLTQDIDASDTANWNDAGTDVTVLEGFKPIGDAGTWDSDTLSWTPGLPFTGVFDGNGFTINGLTINRPNQIGVGLFSRLAAGATVKNVRLDGLVADGYYPVGGLAGLSFGTLSSCSVTGAVSGIAFVGGLIGRVEAGTLNRCHAAGVTSGALFSVGGLAGDIQSGTLRACYAMSTVDGDSAVGGLAGSSFGTIETCYAASAVTGNSTTGGLVGEGLGTVNKSYWDITVSGQATSAGGAGRTTLQMKQQATFVGWNFITVWGIAAGVGYPYLTVAPTFTVTFDAQGGSVNPTNKTVTFDDAYGALPTPTRTGFTFGGWQATTNGVTFGVTPSTFVSIASDHTLTAAWTVGVYTVTFNPAGGTVSPASKSVTFGTAYGVMPTPTRKGYTFAGWWTGAGGTGTPITGATLVTATFDHTVYAKWMGNTYTVTFDPAGGTVSPANKSVTFDSAYGTLPTPSRTGYTFGGWWTGAGGTGSQLTDATVVSETSDHTVYATWKVNTYTVTLNPNGGEVKPVNKTVTFAAAYGELPTPTRTGHAFTAWQATTNGTLFNVTSNTVVSIASNHTLIASWKTVSYTVTFDPQGGTVNPSSKVVLFGEKYGALPLPVLPAPVRVGYAFNGWFMKTNGTEFAVAENTTVNTPAHHTLYAKWTAEPYVCDPTGDAPLTTTGQYVGYLYNEAPFADTVASAIRGTFALTLTQTNGNLTAKAVTQKGSLSFTSKAWDATASSNGTRQATLSARGGEKLLLLVRQNRLWGTLSGGALGGETLNLDGSRNRFSNRLDTEAQTLLEANKGYYTLALPPYTAISTGSSHAAPEGSGYLTLTVGSGGSVKIVGRLADGTSLSQSATLILFNGCGPETCVPLFVSLYSRTGWTGGLLWITTGGKGSILTDRDLGWFVRWEKPSGKPDGASALLDAVGGYYGTVPSLATHYLFSAETNAVPYHTSGGTVKLQTAALPDNTGVSRTGTRLSITRGTAPVLSGGAYDYSAENSAMATFSFTSRTGIFTGTFNLYYDNLLTGRLRHVIVRAPYAGVLTPIRGAAFAGEPAGQGYYLVPDNNPSLGTFPLKRSYGIILEEGNESSVK